MQLFQRKTKLSSAVVDAKRFSRKRKQSEGFFQKLRSVYMIYKKMASQCPRAKMRPANHKGSWTWTDAWHEMRCIDSPKSRPCLSWKAKREKRVTFKFERPRHKKKTLIRKTYVEERLQKTGDDVPETKPNRWKPFSWSTTSKQADHSCSVKRIEEAGTKKRRQRIQHKRVSPAIQNIKEVNGSDEGTWSCYDVKRNMKSKPSIVLCANDRHLS